MRTTDYADLHDIKVDRGVTVADVLHRNKVEDDTEHLAHELAELCLNHCFQVSWGSWGCAVRPYQGIAKNSLVYSQSYRQPTLRQALAHCLAALLHERKTNAAVQS